MLGVTLGAEGVAQREIVFARLASGGDLVEVERGIGGDDEQDARRSRSGLRAHEAGLASSRSCGMRRCETSSTARRCVRRRPRARPRRGRRSHLDAHLRRLQQPLQRVAQTVAFARRDQQARHAILDHLRDRANARGDDGQ